MRKDQQFWELRLGMDFLTIMFLLSSQQGVSVNPNPNPKTEFFKKKIDPDPEFYWHPAEMEKRLK